MDNTNPPIVSTRPSVVPILERINLSSLFSVTDADANSTVTKYRFRDNGAAGGSFILGEEVLSANVYHEVPGFQLGSVTYRGASTFDRESFSIQVFDGVYWSNVSTNTITSGNVSPVVTGTEGRVSAAESVRIDQFFTTTDGDSDPIIRYLLVDRSIGSNGGQFYIDGAAQQQARWITVEAGDLSRVMYRGADQGPYSEKIGVLAWDGYSWSELTEFDMNTTTEPLVIGTSESVLVDQRRSAVAFFTTEDADNDSIFSYNFVDYRINSNGGYWEYDGQRMESAKWFTVLAKDLGKLFYVGGSVGPQSEGVGVQVYDGYQFSDVTNFQIQTVPFPKVMGLDNDIQRGHYLNMATGGTKNSINGPVTGSMPILKFMDVDISEVDEYQFNDRSLNSNGGHFVFKNVRMPSASYFRVQADELDQLFYRGGEFGPQSENVSVLVSANGVWSDVSTFEMGTLKNEFAPDLNLYEVNAKTGVLMKLSGMFAYGDRDGDAIESFSIFDDGDDPDSGYFTVNGSRQPAKTWITLGWDELSTVKYQLSRVGSTENIRMTLYDGRAISNVESAAVNAIAAPVIDATVNDISVDTIERVPASSLITKVDSGPSYTQYQVYDENDFFRSGRLELDGNDLQQGVVHTLTADEFDRMVFKGAEVDFGRQLDPMLVRAENGITGWSDWERINVNTDPVGTAALVSGTQWTDDPGPKTEITYMFIDGNGAHPAPTYYVCEPADNPDDECNTAGEDRPLNQAQRESIREVLKGFEVYADLKFVEVPYSQSGADATMIFGAAVLSGGAAAWAYYPSGHVDSGKGSKPGDVWFDTGSFDPATNFDVGLGTGFRFTTVHEVGHALGLKHPFDGSPVLSVFVDYDYNTVMSYTHDSENNPFDPYPESPTTASLYDVNQIQNLYGQNMDYNTGNNHYGNYFSGSAPNFISNDEQHQTVLWDAGGTDTLNFTNHVADESIDLREGTWTTVNGVPQSVRIAYGAVFENARGGSGDDTIRGNEIKNLLFGNAGNDVLQGGGDNDVLRPGAGDDTVIWSLGDGRDKIREEGNGGLDTIEIYDPSGAVDSLEDDFTIRRFGSELRIDLTLDQGPAQGTVSVIDFDKSGSSVELLRLHGLLGAQVGNDIDLVSLFDIATAAPTRYYVTDTLGQNGGYIAAPVT